MSNVYSDVLISRATFDASHILLCCFASSFRKLDYKRLLNPDELRATAWPHSDDPNATRARWDDERNPTFEDALAELERMSAVKTDVVQITYATAHVCYALMSDFYEARDKLNDHELISDAFDELERELNESDKLGR
jgi:hypothetical protein